MNVFFGGNRLIERLNRLANQATVDNNVLIRSGEAPAIGWSRNMLYSGVNILPRSVFWSANFNGRSDNSDVIPLNETLS